MRSLVFQNAYGPAVKRFRHELSQWWPRITGHLSIAFKDASGHSRGGMFQDLDDELKLPEGDARAMCQGLVSG